MSELHAAQEFAAARKAQKEARARQLSWKSAPAPDSGFSISPYPIFFHMPNGVYGQLSQSYRSQFAFGADDIGTLIDKGDDVATLLDEEDDVATLVDKEDDVATLVDEEGLQAHDSGREIAFVSAEQFMEYCKATKFNNIEIAHRILATEDSEQHKVLGQLVSGFDASRWDTVLDAVVMAGNRAKFEQNTALKGILLSTRNRLLVNAAADDRVYGIGYNAKRAAANKATWGENLLGVVLMAIREQLRGE